ncbi:hypothetical protein [Pectinatus frisingensis]|uniref:hypothetical protein n=1 Tax=Pectinatus frisingensis TaxID=865 RepID=UPI001E4361A7|nr:hypothetical protein [Pectinatus frisingensis]
MIILQPVTPRAPNVTSSTVGSINDAIIPTELLVEARLNSINRAKLFSDREIV